MAKCLKLEETFIPLKFINVAIVLSSVTKPSGTAHEDTENAAEENQSGDGDDALEIVGSCSGNKAQHT